MTSKDDIMTSWKLDFIILPRPSFGARCPKQGLSPGLPLSLFRFGPLVFIWMASNTRRENSFDSLSRTFTPVQSISWPPLRTTCSLTDDFKLAALDLCSERRFPNFKNILTVLTRNLKNCLTHYFECHFWVPWTIYYKMHHFSKRCL